MLRLWVGAHTPPAAPSDSQQGVSRLGLLIDCRGGWWGGRMVKEKRREKRKPVLQTFSTMQGRPISWHFIWKFAGNQRSLSIDYSVSSSHLLLGLLPLCRYVAAIWHLAGEEQLQQRFYRKESIAEMDTWQKSGVGASWTFGRSVIPPECCSCVQDGYRVVLEGFFSPAKIWLYLVWSKSVVSQSSSICSVCLF